MSNPSTLVSGFNLSFDHGIAENVGIDAAILFNHILYWLKMNASKSKDEMIEGKYWMYETQKEMSDFFGFFSEDQISRALKKLIDSGLIIKKCLDKNPFDRTGYYTVYDQSIIKKSLRNPENCGIGSFKSAESEPLKSAESEHRKSAECIYSTLEEQENIKQQQQGAAVEEKKSFSSETINYKTPSGKTKSIESSEIYAHFLKSNFKTEVIAEAIQIVKSKQEPIGNILKLLESVCLTLAQKPTKTINSSEKKKHSWESVPKRTDKPHKMTEEDLKKFGIKIKDEKNV